MLEHLGLASEVKRIPGWVLGLPLSRLKWFIEGYREGDGVHSGTKFEEGIRHEFSTTSTALKDDLVVAFARFGLVASVGRYNSRFRARTGDRTYPFWRLTLCRVNPWSPLEWDRGVSQIIQAKRTGDLVWAAVRSVDEVAATDLVYDFCVPGAENFVAGTGVMAHNTYGPRLALADGRVVSNFLAQAMRGESLTVFGDGKQTRSFCYVDDEVRGLLALLESDHVGPMNIGNPDEFTMLELAEIVLDRHRHPRRDRVPAAARRRSETASSPTSHSPASARVGIRPSISPKVSPSPASGTGGHGVITLTRPRSSRKLSVIVPVYDERNTVVEIVRRMRAVELPPSSARFWSSTTAAPTAPATYCGSSATARCG